MVINNVEEVGGGDDVDIFFCSWSKGLSE